ncbi:MAG TPA: hypothetical protein VGL94_12885 [Ktedonobacteraceae bacterium]
MFYTNGWPRYGTKIKMSIPICFTFILICFLFAPQVSAQGTRPLSNGPRIKKIDAGFGGMYRDGNWVPIQISLENNGPEFDGKITITIPSSFNNPGATISSTTTYGQAISLPSLSNKQVTMHVPITSGIQGYNQPFTANLIDSNGHKVTSQSATLQNINNGTLFIGLVTASASPDPTFLIASLSNLHVSIQLQIVKPDQFPSNVAVLNNFDMLVLDNLTGGSFTHDQVAGLQSWVEQGGTLVTVGGPEWSSTLGQLSSNLLPVTITGDNNVPAGTHLLPISTENSNGDQSDTIANPVSISVATPHPGTSILLSSGTTPLVVQANEGQGLVYYLAYDPFLSPLVNWAGTSRLWEGLIFRSLGNQLLSANTASNGSALSWQATLYGNMDSFLYMLVPNLLPPMWLILGLLLSYILILGPLRLLVVQWTKKRDWSWRIVLSTIVIFSLLSYGLALEEKGTSIISSHISVIQLNRSDGAGSSEHVTDYMGIFVPNQGDFQIRIPASNLIQPIDPVENYYFVSNVGRSLSEKRKTAITSFSNETDVDLQGVSIWTLHTLVSHYDAHTTGGLASHLVLSNQQKNKVTGTVTNTLPYTLNDAYLLIGEDFASLGTLAPGQTKPVSLRLNSSLNFGTQSLLADRIATYNGLSTSSSSNTSPLDTLHRHMYMLTALSNDCGMGPCPDGSNPSGMQTTMQDPLLLSGASATLIGWASSQSTETSPVTIGGTTSPQIQEALIQAPLNLNFSGTVDIPASLIPSQITNIQGANGNLQGYGSSRPGVYCMATGSMTFELTLPTLSQLQNSSLDFTEPQNPVGGVGSCASGAVSDVTHLNIKLYNWQTGTWDEKTFSTYEFKVDNAQAYIGPGGRILIQFDNQDSSLGSVVFSTPAVELKGTLRAR